MIGLSQQFREPTLDQFQEGVIRLAKYDMILGDYTAWLDNNGTKVAITREELELYDIKGNLQSYVGTTIKYSILEYDPYREIYLGTCKPAKRKRQQEIINALKQGESFEAKVIKIVYFGAYLAIESLTVILRNKDFSSDYTVVGDIFQKGDKMTVCLQRISQNGKVNVQTVPKYENPHRVELEDFQPQTVVSGIIRSIKPWACFVNIAPNLDAICPIPMDLEIKEGMRVAFRINQVRQEDRRIRGKIIKVLD